MAGLIAEHEKSLSTIASSAGQGHLMLSAVQQQQMIPLNQSKYRFEYFMAKKEAAAAQRVKILNPLPQ